VNKSERKELKTFPKDIQKIILDGERAVKNMRATDPEPIHTWFELTYANYLAIPRSVLQSMPRSWQKKFVALLEQLDELIDWRRSGLEISRRDESGKFIVDDLVDYARGRRRVPLRGVKVPKFSNRKARVAFLADYLPHFAPSEWLKITEEKYNQIAANIRAGR
jgi:hypothetical protein